jgi:hypothetical protein
VGALNGHRYPALPFLPPILAAPELLTEEVTYKASFLSVLETRWGAAGGLYGIVISVMHMASMV